MLASFLTAFVVTPLLCVGPDRKNKVWSNKEGCDGMRALGITECVLKLKSFVGIYIIVSPFVHRRIEFYRH